MSFSGSAKTIHEPAYRPFPSFAEFSKALVLDSQRWDGAARQLDELSQGAAELLGQSLGVAMKAAAIETGAIEGLYETDRGFTFTVAAELATLEAVRIAKGEKVHSLVAAQIQAYEYVLDLATKTTPLSESWIRQLHTVICAAQDTYRVHVGDGGFQEHTLAKGEYKSQPNHVLKASGGIHAYAPVLLVSSEMQRFCSELASDAFQSSHPVIQAAYAHYAFVVIHPFIDGNGRVARALASVFTYRAVSVPVLILVAHKHRYFLALEAADEGNYQAFVDFMAGRTLDAINLVVDQMLSAHLPDPIVATQAIAKLYVSGEGWTHQEIDNAGVALAAKLEGALRREFNRLPQGTLTIQLSVHQSNTPELAGFRGTNNQATATTTFVLASPEPAVAQCHKHIAVLVPRADSGGKDFLLSGGDDFHSLRLPIDEIMSGIDGTVPLRIEMFARRVFSQAVHEVHRTAEMSLRARGY